ncbi:MAG: hypothetical protein MJA83_05705 [Gammaproteobacteria bacterium]|nr:hypothetical protein [Gammaproteobacteria bacterium]
MPEINIEQGTQPQINIDHQSGQIVIEQDTQPQINVAAPTTTGNLVKGVAGPVASDIVAVFDGGGFQIKIPNADVSFEAQNIVNVGSVVGGTGASDELTARGSSDSGLGRFRVLSPFEIGNDGGAGVEAGDQVAFRYRPDFAAGGGFNGGLISSTAAVTQDDGIFIWSMLSETSSFDITVNPTFAAFTNLNVIPTITTSAGFGLSALVVNVGLIHETTAIGTTTIPSTTGLSFVPQARSTISGGTLNRTNQTAVQVRPTHSTVTGGTVGHGNIRGVHCEVPTVALFQPANGTETLTSYVGLDYEDQTFGGNVEKVAVRSAQSAATNAYFLRHTGNAQSVLGGQLRFDADLTGITFGASQDINMGWAGPTNEFFLNFLLTGDDIRFSNPSANRILVQGDVQATELNMNFDRMSWGAQSGANGNSVFTIVMPARTASINGDWVDILETAAGNLTVNASLNAVSSRVTNSVSITSGTGSISSDVATERIGGMTVSGLGGADTAAMHVTGRRTARGVDAFEPLTPAALGADVNDYAPATGNSMRQIWRLEASGASRTITGIAVQQSVDTQWIINVGSNNIVLAHQNAGSTAGNRFISPTGANYTLGPDESALLWHDDVTDRWRILPGTGA